MSIHALQTLCPLWFKLSFLVPKNERAITSQFAVSVANPQHCLVMCFTASQN